MRSNRVCAGDPSPSHRPCAALSNPGRNPATSFASCTTVGTLSWPPSAGTYAAGGVRGSSSTKRPTPGPCMRAGSRKGARGRGRPRVAVAPSPREPTDFETKPLAHRRVTLPAEDFNSNPVRIEDEECVVARLVAILLRREVNVCAACEAACVRFINVLSSVNLEGDVLDADVVVAVGAAVGWTQAETTVTDFSSHEVDDLLRASVGRIPDPLRPSERPEQVEIEGERPLNVGDGELDVMDALGWHDSRGGCVRPTLSKPRLSSLAYSRSPAAPRASDLSKYSAMRATLPLRMVSTCASS